MAAPTARMHGQTHAKGGPDPIPGMGGGGIQFDTDPQQGTFLEVDTTGDINVGAGLGGSGVGYLGLAGQSGAGLDGHGDDGVSIVTHGAGDLLIQAGGTSGSNIVLRPGSRLKMEALPTTDPGVANAVWSDNGTLVLSGHTAGGGGSSTPDPTKVDKDAVEAATNRLVQVKLAAGDTQPAFRIAGDGTHTWGQGGTTAPDVNLYRSAGVLKTDVPVQAQRLTVSPGTANEIAVWSDGHIYFGSASDTFIFRHGAGYLRTGGGLVTDGESYVGFITTTSRLWFGNTADTAIWRSGAGVIGATFGGLGDRGIVYGAPDSGGTGFRMLRIPN